MLVETSQDLGGSQENEKRIKISMIILGLPGSEGCTRVVPKADFWSLRKHGY
jgi:hypothetical protein